MASFDGVSKPKDLGTTIPTEPVERTVGPKVRRTHRPSHRPEEIPKQLTDGGTPKSPGGGQRLLGDGSIESVRLGNERSRGSDGPGGSRSGGTDPIGILDAAFGAGISKTRRGRLLDKAGLRLEEKDGQRTLRANASATGSLRSLALQGGLREAMDRWGVDRVDVTERDGSVTPLVALKRSASGDSVFTVRQAQEVLERLASNPKVPFDVVEDGCVDRVEVMISDLISMGVPPSAMGLVASRTPDLQIKKLDEVARRLKEDGDKSDLNVFSMPDQLSARAKAGFSALTPEVGQARDFEIDGQKLTLFADGSVQAEGLALNPKDRVWWSVGHIALEPQLEEGEGRLLMDPSASKELVSISDWKAAQNLDDGEIYEGALDEKPIHLPEHSSDRRLAEAVDILGDLGLEPETPATTRADRERFVRSSIEALPEGRRADFYDRFHRTDREGEPFRYEQWDGYSIAGRPTDASGDPLPRWEDMDPGSEAFITRRDRATEPREDDGLGLAPLRAFAELMKAIAQGDPPKSTLRSAPPNATAVGGMYKSSDPEPPAS